MIPNVYRDGDKLVMDCGKSPSQFQGVLSIVYTWTPKEDWVEAVYPSDRLKALPPVCESSLSTRSRQALIDRGLLAVASKPTAHDTRASGRSYRVGSGQRRERRPSPSVDPIPMEWRQEYKEALVGIWDGWAFCFTPLIVVWLPFALAQTALWSLAALDSWLNKDALSA